MLAVGGMVATTLVTVTLPPPTESLPFHVTVLLAVLARDPCRWSRSRRRERQRRRRTSGQFVAGLSLLRASRGQCCQYDAVVTVA